VRHRALSSSQRLVREAIQLHGAMGYTADSEIAPFVQRALVMSARVAGAQEELARAPAIAWGVEAPGAECVPAPRNEAGAPDHDWNTLDDAAFRATVRGWIGANYPDELRYLARQLRWAEIKDWHARLVARGWVAPAWPRAYGGMGLDPAKLLIFIEECERHGVARAPDQGIVMLGPILFEYGTAEQRARWLEPARTGEHIWCQGYSEPNAGSDLAALSTRAEPDGDDFLISGQKTWTTHGLDATHMYCLARTDAAAKPQAGISFFLIDLAQAGVTVRPLENLSGDVDFCAVFLDRVRVPRANLIGELNHGWTIAKSLLGHERLFVGSPKLCQRALSQLRALARARGRVRDPVFVHALTASALEVMDLEALYGEFAALVRGGGTPGADVAILKIHSTEVYVRLSEMILAVAGADAGVRGAQDCGGTAVDVLGHFYNARPAPIYAGSNEIQRNIVAKQVLGLPT
jgi:alkylation response protein AidB-like acyl-CoA dehydrogenase